MTINQMQTELGEAHNGAHIVNALALDVAVMEMSWGVSMTARELAGMRDVLLRSIAAYLIEDERP